MNITINGTEYPVSESLRVAFEMQKDFKKPYGEVFSSMSDMQLQDQVKMIYLGYKLENEDPMTFSAFFDLILDHWTLKNVMETCGKIIRGITGYSAEDEADDDDAEKKATTANMV